MIKKNKVTTKYITEKYLDKRLEEQDKRLEKTLDERFEKQDKHFDKRMDKRFNKQTAEIDKRMNKRFEEQNKRFDRRMDGRFEEYTKVILDAFNSRFNRLDTRIDDLRTELKSDIDNPQVALDKTTKSQADHNQEFVIVKAEVNQMKQVFKQKLGVEIRAV